MELNKQDEKLLQELLKKYKTGLISGLIPGSNISLTSTGCRDKIISSTGDGGSGDMLRSTYDRTNVNASAFDMENMIEGATKKILTSAERTKLNNLSGTNTGDQDLTPYLTSATAAATYQPIGSYLTSISGLNISQLTNDSGYITSAALSPYLTTSAAASTYQPILVSGTSIKTINGTSLLGAGDITISAAAALSDITDATAAHTINNAAFQQEWKWDSLGSGIGLKISTASTAATANTQVLMELRKTGVTSDAGYGSTLLNVINEDGNPSYVTKAAHFEAKNFAATFGKTGIGTGYGNVAILGNSKLHFLHNGVQSAYIYRLYNAPILHIVPPPEGSVNIGTGSLNMISFDKGAVAGNSFMGVGYSSTTKQTQVFGGDPYLGYRAASTHAGVIENESGVLKFSANTGLLGGYNNFTPTWQLVLHGANNNVGVGTLTPNTSAKLDVSSTTQGFAPPEMTATQASAISTTTRKLIIYVTDTNGTFTSAGLWMWNGTTWKLILAE